MTTEDWLKEHCREEIPAWLRNYVPGDKVAFKDAMAGHVVYYPGSGNDGEPVRIFNQSHSAHVFLYVDYGVSEQRLDEQLHSEPFAGYHSLGSVNYRQKDIASSFTQHVQPTREQLEFMKHFIEGEPFCRMVVLERDRDRGEDFGAERFAVIFLLADGIATYDALFCNKFYPPPFVVLLHDYGMGGDYASFGRDGLMEKCAVRTGIFPQLLLVASNTEAWLGYHKIEGLPHAVAGRAHDHHYLFQR
jgi:hypothetical protein